MSRRVSRFEAQEALQRAFVTFDEAGASSSSFVAIGAILDRCGVDLDIHTILAALSPKIEGAGAGHAEVLAHHVASGVSCDRAVGAVLAAALTEGLALGLLLAHEIEGDG